MGMQYVLKVTCTYRRSTFRRKLETAKRVGFEQNSFFVFFTKSKEHNSCVLSSIVDVPMDVSVNYVSCRIRLDKNPALEED